MYPLSLLCNATSLPLSLSSLERRKSIIATIVTINKQHTPPPMPPMSANIDDDGDDEVCADGDDESGCVLSNDGMLRDGDVSISVVD